MPFGEHSIRLIDNTDDENGIWSGRMQEGPIYQDLLDKQSEPGKSFIDNLIARSPRDGGLRTGVACSHDRLYFQQPGLFIPVGRTTTIPAVNPTLSPI
jgi:hypothetical protein